MVPIYDRQESDYNFLQSSHYPTVKYNNPSQANKQQNSALNYFARGFVRITHLFTCKINKNFSPPNSGSDCNFAR
jgi:hypothetical protein